MHDSRGAQLKVGDRVLIEAEVKELQPNADADYCNVTIQVVTPEQTNKTPMSPPSLSAINTKMLTKVGAVILLLFAFASSAFAQSPVKKQSCQCTNCECTVLAKQPVYPSYTFQREAEALMPDFYNGNRLALGLPLVGRDGRIITGPPDYRPQQRTQRRARFR
jgi:hypothetical protein